MTCGLSTLEEQLTLTVILNWIRRQTLTTGASGLYYEHISTFLNKSSALLGLSFLLSHHEQGVYDIPAVLTLMLKETGNEKISFICHSMGCGAYTIALAENPELNDKFHAAFFMAPALYFGHCYTPLRSLFRVVQAGPYIQVSNKRLLKT